MSVSETIDFGFISDWMKKWCKFFNQSGGVASANPLTFRHLNENHSIEEKNAKPNCKLSKQQKC